MISVEFKIIKLTSVHDSWEKTDVFHKVIISGKNMQIIKFQLNEVLEYYNLQSDSFKKWVVE